MTLRVPEFRRRTSILAPRTLFLLLSVFSAHAADSLIIDTNTTFQTIRAWGAPTGGLIQYSDPLLGALLDEMVFSMGLNRARLEPPRRGNEDPLNDDGDPFNTDPAAFSTADLDARIHRVFLPLQRRVETRGERFEWYASPSFFNNGSTGSAPAWMLNSPGEFAEWYLATLQHLRQHYNLRPHFFVICNEAANDNAFSTPVVATLIKTLAPRLQALGFTGSFQFPESVNANTSWSAIQSVQSDTELWRWIGLASYHLYGSITARTNIRDFALARNLPTAQTEYMGLNLNILYDDLTLGGVSRWELYAMNDFFPVNTSQTWFSRSSTYWQLRQVTQFVRPGSRRIAALSDNPNLRALAFARNGLLTSVLLNTTDGLAHAVEVSGLAPGLYARSLVVGGTPSELGPIAVPGSGTLTLALPANSVLTLYPHGDTNLPPVAQNWSATPPFLTYPANSVNLSAAGFDPELTAVTYNWAILSQPAGATTVLSSSNTASCTAGNMNLPGDYLFQIAFSDGTNRLTRTLPVTVYASNQPPEIRDLHNRKPVNVILPVNATTLRGSAFDREGDTPSYQWSVVSQPPGASASLLAPTTTSCVATNLDVAGDYVFRLRVIAGTHTVQADHHVTVQPLNHAPQITAAAATPSLLTLPAQSASLTAASSDPDGDIISHWWSVQSAPAGARPLFSSQGSTNTMAYGLVLPGTYTFRLTAVDRAAFTTRDVTVTVNAGTNPPLLFLAAPNGSEAFAAGQSIWIRWAANNVAGNVKLEWFNGAVWQTITPSTPNDGAELWTLPYGSFSNCKVRITGGTDNTLLDESDAPFTITAETPRFIQFNRSDRGQVDLEFEQQPDTLNVLQRSFTLTTNDWQTLRTFDGEAQAVLFSEPTNPDRPQAFYRVTVSQPKL